MQPTIGYRPKARPPGRPVHSNATMVAINKATGELALIDQNIKNAPRPLRGWWCENCKRKFFHPEEPKPLCPHCYSKGMMVRARRYF